MSSRRWTKFLRFSDTKTIHGTCDRINGNGLPPSELAHAWEGPQAENAFEEAWKEKTCVWVTKVTRTTGTYKDQYEHTDFEITLCNGVIIKVDVKASVNAARDFKAKRHGIERQVVIVIADRNASFDDIRKRTVEGIEKFLKLTDKEVLEKLPPRRKNAH